MIMIKNAESLDFEISLLEKRRRALRELFDKGRISQNTFDLLDKKISNIESLIINLKNIIEKETEFWKSMILKESKILESILVNYKFLNLMGEIDFDEWNNISKIIDLGIKSLSKKSFSKHKEETVFETISKEDLITVDFKDAVPSIKETFDALRKQKRKAKADNVQIDRKSVRVGAVKSSDSHCMNPWKPECRRTNIKLSIYYNGQFLPICEECWKEISKKNIEWTT